jgi:hypothetical protein
MVSCGRLEGLLNKVGGSRRSARLDRKAIEAQRYCARGSVFRSLVQVSFTGSAAAPTACALKTLDVLASRPDDLPPIRPLLAHRDDFGPSEEEAMALSGMTD